MIAVRPMHPRDERFVVSAWVMSFRESQYAGLVSFADWHKVMRPTVAKILARPTVQTIVAHETEDPDPTADLYGFLTVDMSGDQPLVFYVYTKNAYRKAGIARRLFQAAGIDPALPFRYVCRTPAVAEVYNARKIPCAKWDPVSARNYERRVH